MGFPTYSSKKLVLFIALLGLIGGIGGAIGWIWSPNDQIVSNSKLAHFVGLILNMGVFLFYKAPTPSLGPFWMNNRR